MFAGNRTDTETRKKEIRAEMRNFNKNLLKTTVVVCEGGPQAESLQPAELSEAVLPPAVPTERTHDKAVSDATFKMSPASPHFMQTSGRASNPLCQSVRKCVRVCMHVCCGFISLCIREKLVRPLKLLYSLVGLITEMFI